MSEGEPAALEKAKSLHRFALNSGSSLREFVLCLTEPEALDLVEWYAREYEGISVTFDTDLEEVRRTGNPWPILKNFNVMGLQLAALEKLH